MLSSLIKLIVQDKHVTSLKPGMKAPLFSCEDQDGNAIKLSELQGKKVILFFYPKDNTPGCTKQSCNLRDNYSLLKKKGYVVLGVSADDQKSHRRFREKYKLPFPLLVDVDHKLIRLYDVWGKKKFIGRVYDGINRTTFVIDEKGKIEKVITAVKTGDHTSQVLEEE